MKTKLLFRVCLVFASGLQTIAAASFEVEGFISKTVFRETNVEMTIKKTFKAVVQGCESFYRTYPENSSDFVQVFTDGKETIQKAVYLAPNKESAKRPTTLSVEKRPFPRDDASQINFLWLAYGSACYLDQQTGGTLEPIWLQDDFKDDHHLKAFWSRKGNAPPHDIAYMSDGFWRFSQPKPGEIRIPPPFGSGFTNATYQVIQSTNVDGVAVPTKFVFNIFAVFPRQKEAVMYKRAEIVAEATRVQRVAEKRDLRPSLERAEVR